MYRVPRGSLKSLDLSFHNKHFLINFENLLSDPTLITTRKYTFGGKQENMIMQHFANAFT